MKNYTYVTFLRFLRFFENPKKNITFYVFSSCYTRFLEHWSTVYMITATRCCREIIPTCVAYVVN